MDEYKSRNRVTVQEAAAKLGVTEQAVRKRIKRGTIPHERESDGRLYVYLDEVVDEERDDVPNPYADRLISEMSARIASLERQLEEANTRDRESRRLLAAALERIPEIEAAERRETSETTAESAATGTERVEPQTASAEAHTSSQRPESTVAGRFVRWLRGSR